MSTYRVEWPCCGSVTETEAWEPSQCPFCPPATTPAQGAIPAGWKLVPVEPTDDMLNAVSGEPGDDMFHTMRAQYREDWATMLAATPEPAEPPASQPVSATSEAADVDVLRSLVRAILSNAQAFQWSLQGMGMLRLHLPGNYRLHVWDSRYRVPNVSMVHDHLQWGLTSTVVAGELTNRRYVEAVGGEPFMFATLKPGYGCYFKSEPQPVTLRALRGITYEPGGTYAQEPAEIHWTDAKDGTVTLMHKRPTADESARVFWRRGNEWVSAEPRRATPEEVAAITGYALDRWFGGSMPSVIAIAAEAPQEAAQPDLMACGHPRSSMLVSAETGADLYCEHCDDKSARRDAETREAELATEVAALKRTQEAAQGQAMPDDATRRYQFLLGFLIERGVLTERRYGNGTWSLQGIYGVDDSGLRGAGRTPEEALDNAIIATNLDPDAARKFWSDTHAALAQPVAARAGKLSPKRIEEIAVETGIDESAMTEKEWKGMRRFARSVIAADRALASLPAATSGQPADVQALRDELHGIIHNGWPHPDVKPIQERGFAILERLAALASQQAAGGVK